MEHPRSDRGAIGRIQVMVDTEADGQVVLTVQDDGPGIPDKVLPRLANISRVSRRAMAAPSAGSAKVHAVEQAQVVAAAFA